VRSSFVERRLECAELLHETLEGTDVQFVVVCLAGSPHKRQMTKSKSAGTPFLHELGRRVVRCADVGAREGSLLKQCFGPTEITEPDAAILIEEYCMHHETNVERARGEDAPLPGLRAR
jgi:hypothetical protein